MNAPLRILLSASACHPYLGSEPRVGWTVAYALASRGHSVWVLTHRDNEEGVLRGQKEGRIPENLRFFFVGKVTAYAQNTAIAKLQAWGKFLSWKREALAAAQQLHQDFNFDLIHHATLVTWRVGVPFHQMGVPFIWGPIGGAEPFPKGFSSILSRHGKIFESVRNFSNFTSFWSTSVRRCAREADCVVATNEETYRLLEKLRGRTEGLFKLSATFFSEAELQRLQAPRSQHSCPLRLFGGGFMEGRKGVAMALQGLALAKEKGFSFRYTVTNTGPEAEHLKLLSISLGLGNEVTFCTPFQGDEFIRELASADLYVLPSLRDNSPVTLMEAMAAGCVPVVADCGGPAEIVTATSGFRVKITTPKQMASDLADIFLKLDQDRPLLLAMAEEAKQRIAAEYSDSAYFTKINRVYDYALCSKKTETE